MPSTSVKSVRIAAWLLILTLLSASIDRIADPPAVNPHASQCFAFSLNHSLEAASAQSCQSAGWLQTNQSEPGWVYFALDARSPQSQSSCNSDTSSWRSVPSPDAMAGPQAVLAKHELVSHACQSGLLQMHDRLCRI